MNDIQYHESPKSLADLPMYEKVQIGSQDAEWKGMFGIVENITPDAAYIMCVNNPSYFYVVSRDNLRDVILITYE